jgi:hypothetical protein
VAFTAYRQRLVHEYETMNIALERMIDDVRHQFSEEPPNGWLLGWDRERYLALVQNTCVPFVVTNTTSFDYAFCNRFEVRFDEPAREHFWVLTVRISFVLPIFSLHWTKYDSTTVGTVVTQVAGEHREVEESVRRALESIGLNELPEEWSEEEVGGVELELSGANNVTISKCLFEDYAG